jgi:FkbM family methyltransferase
MQKQKIMNEIRKIEKEYLKPQNFKKYANYWLPEKVVKESKNVLSFGIHRDVRWEQAIIRDNPDLNVHLYDPTPDSVRLFNMEFPGKENMTFHPEAWAEKNGTMKFYYDRNRINMYSLKPMERWGGVFASYIEVPAKNMKTILERDMPQVDIIKADIEGVWLEHTRDILDNNIDFKAYCLECEIEGWIDAQTSLGQYENLLKEFIERGYDLYLNTPRDKPNSESIILKKGILD